MDALTHSLVVLVNSVVPQDIADVTYMATIGNSFGYGGVQAVSPSTSQEDADAGPIFDPEVVRELLD